MKTTTPLPKTAATVPGSPDYSAAKANSASSVKPKTLMKADTFVSGERQSYKHTACIHCLNPFAFLLPAPNANAIKTEVFSPKPQFTYRAASQLPWVTWPGQNVEEAGVIWKMLLGNEGAESNNAMAMGIARIRTGQKLDLHRHRAPEFYYILGGAGNTEIDGHTITAQSGQAYFIPGNAPHVSQASQSESLDFAFFFPYQSFNQVEYEMHTPRAPIAPRQGPHTHAINLESSTDYIATDETLGQRGFMKRLLSPGERIEFKQSDQVAQVFILSGHGIMEQAAQTQPLEPLSAISVEPTADKAFVNHGDTHLEMLLITVG